MYLGGGHTTKNVMARSDCDGALVTLQMLQLLIVQHLQGE